MKGTYHGDANLDLEFNSSDLVQVFASGKYEVAEHASWAEGDWDSNGFFDSSDMVTAFSCGGYEQGLKTAAATVPEPTSILMLLAGAGWIRIAIRRRLFESPDSPTHGPASSGRLAAISAKYCGKNKSLPRSR